MWGRIAEKLLLHVFCPVSAAVSVGEEGVRFVHVFDTKWYSSDIRLDPKAEEIWLISNHPEGNPALYEEDRDNLQRIRACSPHMRIRFFIANEDTGCMETDVEKLTRL